jgi:hypothetical protein
MQRYSRNSRFRVTGQNASGTIDALESRQFDVRVARHDLRALVQPIVEMMDRFSERHPIVCVAPDCPSPYWWMEIDFRA